MKKLFVFLIIIGVFMLVFSEQVTVLADIFVLGDPQIYEVKEGDWLSKVAQRHYSDMHLWRQLALINMAPNPDYILPGEKILLPDAEAMKKLKSARTISGVTGLVETQMLALRGGQEKTELAEREKPAEAGQPEIDPDPVPAEEEAADFPWVLFIAVPLIVFGIAGLMIIRAVRRKKQSEAHTGRESTASKTMGEDGGHDESRQRRVRKSRQDHKEEEAPFA